MSVRILRLMEYIYPDYDAAYADMRNWGVPPTGTKEHKKGHEIRSAIITVPEFEKPMTITEE